MTFIFDKLLVEPRQERSIVDNRPDVAQRIKAATLA